MPALMYTSLKSCRDVQVAVASQAVRLTVSTSDAKKLHKAKLTVSEVLQTVLLCLTMLGIAAMAILASDI